MSASSITTEQIKGTNKVVRVAFAIDIHDREVMAWQAATTGISGETIRDLMLAFSR